MTDRPVFYVTRMLPAYRLPIMERLNERLEGRLVVCHGQPPQATSTLMDTVQGDFRTARMRNHWFRGETLHAAPYGHLFETYGPPAVVLAEENPRSVTLPFLLRHARRQGAGRALWGIFYSVFRPFSAAHPLQRYRLAMAQWVDACACYTRSVRDVLRPYVPEDRLFVAQNTLDTDTLFTLRAELAREGKAAVRARLGLPDQPTLVFTGQLIPRKGTDTLLDVFARLRARRPATLLVMGGGPERPDLEARVAREGIPDVHFLGSIPRLEDSAPYLYAADVMFLPGYVGLVINHAFAMGLPLITQHAPGRLPFHGPEVESLEHGRNGLMVARGDDDALLAAVETVLDDRERFARNAVEYVETHLTIDHMVDGLYGAIERAHHEAPYRNA